ncbi:MAG: AtpZ/AtpI family protein [Oscillospiraceae bacterium]|nr:AtpZ/AtpI family protein [Oscillospiraceae bacterium]
MKNLSLLIWLTQLGLSVAMPLGGFLLLAVWLRQRFDWGVWVIIAGVVLGLICAADGLRTSLKAMERMSRQKKEDDGTVSFNDHS